jgi:spermidine/putrescine transport system permease protein
MSDLPFPTTKPPSAGLAAQRRRSREATLRGIGLLAPTWICLGGLFLLPLAILLAMSFRPPDDAGNAAPVDNWHTYITNGEVWANYRESFQPVFLPMHARSFYLAAATTVFCLLIGYPVAHYIALVAPRRWANVLLALAVIPFWTSFLIRVSAWRLILQDQGVINIALMHLHLIGQPIPMMDTNFAVLIGLVYGELPFMILPLYASLEKLDKTLLEASADLGASPASTFWRVTIPLTAPGIVAGSVLVFVPGIGQFIVSDLLGGSRTMLIGNLIQNQFTDGRDKPRGAAFAFELTISVLAMLLAYAFYARRKGGEVLL